MAPFRITFRAGLDAAWASFPALPSFTTPRFWPRLLNFPTRCRTFTASRTIHAPQNAYWRSAGQAPDRTCWGGARLDSDRYSGCSPIEAEIRPQIGAESLPGRAPSSFSCQLQVSGGKLQWSAACLQHPPTNNICRVRAGDQRRTSFREVVGRLACRAAETGSLISVRYSLSVGHPFSNRPRRSTA